MPPTVSWPTSVPSVRPRRTAAPDRPGPRDDRCRTIAANVGQRRRRPGSGLVASHGRSQAALRARTSLQAARSRSRIGPQQHPPVGEPDRPARSRGHPGPARAGVPECRWSPPATWSSRCGSSGPSTASPSRAAPVDPARLTTSVRPARPATPRESTAVGTPCATPYARIASARPGTSRSTTAPGHLRGVVGRASGRCRRS